MKAATPFWIFLIIIGVIVYFYQKENPS